MRIASIQLSINETTEIKANNIELSIQRTTSSSIKDNSSLTIGENQIKLPSICDLIANNQTDCADQEIIQQVAYL
jgi:hypothetical protein